MKCFHFTNGERKDDEDGSGVGSRASKVSWARSLSVASSSVDTRRSEFDSDSRDWSDSVGFYDLLTQRRANDLRVFSFAELKSATRGFSRALLIGEGGFGCVYRGVVRVPDDQQVNGLDSKLDVAIKQLNRHDEDYNAKLSDFGLARQGPPEGLGHVSTSVVGTVGYAAPEYVQTGRLTAKSDVWSFGVVLYELITGRRAVERNLPRSEQKLLEWVRPYVSDSKKFHLIVDPRLEGQYCLKSAQKLASLANKCLMKQPKSRPKMSEVVEILGNIISTTSSQDEDIPQPVSETEDVKEETEAETEPESTKQGNNYLKKVFDIKEMVNLRNRSIGKLDWRNWTPGLVRTW
ncbi:hypothetical protein JRO89_XS13G0127900 [Xanthoceras sorbifolium]|uniref:Protein kinase domain-containing protein n=1 Tax=Xanthoceras sorbifolium TaxID=99658 RepID=A0ABQ8H806_9ROSI|nr:hypothetical protein JRO89_XS13G0127900 [Xanthoceras sorbifolium]